MKELNKHILLEAIASLPSYSPKDNVWDHISMELDADLASTQLKETVAELPKYSPPAFVWDHIEEALKADEVMEPVEEKVAAKVVRFPNWKKYASAAAAIALIISLAIPFISENVDPNISVSYSEEVIQDDIFNDDWDADEDAFQMVMDQCKHRVLACEQPEFKMLKEELEELNMARKQLKEAIGGYNTDSNLLAQLTQIEIERSDILKKMVDRI